MHAHLTRRQPTWRPGSAHVDGNVESDRPTWIMTALRGQQRIDLTSGPLHTHDTAQRLADLLNSTDPTQWNHLIETTIPDVLSGHWG